MNLATLFRQRPEPTPRERLAKVQAQAIPALLARADGKLSIAELDVVARELKEAKRAAEQTDAEYSGDTCSGAIVIRRDGVVICQAERKLVPRTVLEDVLRRRRTPNAHERAARLEAAVIDAFPQLTARTWFVGEFELTQWIRSQPA